MGIGYILLRSGGKVIIEDINLRVINLQINIIA